MPQFTTLDHDKKLLEQYDFILGIDEVGRGCIAGPIMAAGVVVSVSNIKLLENKVCDSKKLSEKKRPNIAKSLIQNFDYFLAQKSAHQIDCNGIQSCNTEIFKNIIEQFEQSYPNSNSIILVDGTIPINKVQSLVKGESISVSIAAASIIAKVMRDNIMTKLENEFPVYGFKNHKGYGTKFHLEAISKHGITIEHRKSFLSNYI